MCRPRPFLLGTPKMTGSKVGSVALAGSDKVSGKALGSVGLGLGGSSGNGTTLMKKEREREKKGRRKLPQTGYPDRDQGRPSPAQPQSKYARGRARVNAGKAWTGLEYDEEAVIEALLRRGMSEADTRDKLKVRVVLEAVILAWALDKLVEK